MKKIFRYLAVWRIKHISFSRWQDSGKYSSCFFSYKGEFYGIHIRRIFGMWTCTLSDGYVHTTKDIDCREFTANQLSELKIWVREKVKEHFLNKLK